MPAWPGQNDAMTAPPDIADRIAVDPALWSDFEAICDCGGRRCGDPGEARARILLADRLRAIGDARGGRVWSEPLPYKGWAPRTSRVQIPGGPWRPVEPLLWSRATPPGGLLAPVVDLGRGAPADFDRAADRLDGAIVIVRHEYMFAPDHIHRMAKFAMAEARGAAGFLIAAETLVAGGVGFGEPVGIPGAGIDEGTARELAIARRARLELDIAEGPAETENLLLDLPGKDRGTVVLSAHIDGHAPGESALDNASGLAACLAAARALASLPRQRTLRVAFFSLEEWGLEGSRRHVEGLSDPERRATRLNVNLDTVAGAEGLTALTSGFADLEPFIERVGAATGIPVACFRPLRRNSDHYNYATAGIPAFRLVAGFSEPQSNVRHLLTADDTRDKASPDQLRRAAAFAAIACHLALTE